MEKINNDYKSLKDLWFNLKKERNFAKADEVKHKLNLIRKNKYENNSKNRKGAVCFF